MTNISFYKLAGDHRVALTLACQLIQKAFSLQQQVLCLTPDQAFAEELDKTLWSITPESFIPHGLGSEHQPISITVDPEPGEHHQILINLQPQIPTWFSRFDRVMEIIYSDPDYEQAKRNNFRFYKERGYPLNFHDLSKKFNP